MTLLVTEGSLGVFRGRWQYNLKIKGKLGFPKLHNTSLNLNSSSARWLCEFHINPLLRAIGYRISKENQRITARAALPSLDKGIKNRLTNLLAFTMIRLACISYPPDFIRWMASLWRKTSKSAFTAPDGTRFSIRSRLLPPLPIWFRFSYPSQSFVSKKWYAPNASSKTSMAWISAASVEANWKDFALNAVSRIRLNMSSVENAATT